MRKKYVAAITNDRFIISDLYCTFGIIDISFYRRHINESEKNSFPVLPAVRPHADLCGRAGVSHLKQFVQSAVYYFTG